jgi:peptidoglycan/LPS O-acetylase OafA/YrhL
MDREVTPWSFMANRIARIAPIYWTITLAVFTISPVAPSLLQATMPDWRELLKSLAFVPFEKSNGLTQPVLFVGWTLNYEMLFYALFAAGLSVRSRRLGAAGVILCLVFWEQPCSRTGSCSSRRPIVFAYFWQSRTCCHPSVVTMTSAFSKPTRVTRSIRNASR